MSMKLNKDFLYEYLKIAPLPLAFERVVECEIYSNLKFERPVLDLGCGDGIFSKIMFKDKVDTGIDPNQSELDHARKKGMYREIILAEGASIPKPDGFYKTIYSNSVLEHIRDINSVLNEVNRVLDRDGKFYVTVPNDKYDQYTMMYSILKRISLNKTAESYREFYNRFWRHYHHYSDKQWEGLIVRAGFKISKKQTYNPEYMCKINDLLVPFSLPAFVSKKLFNQWVVFTFIRKLWVYPLSLIVKSAIKKCKSDQNGGLLFLELIKAS